ncbi:MAG: VanZ family protein [Clostridia bacterium]|nr:VanZ family protein [Clostridia bacterium]
MERNERRTRVLTWAGFAIYVILLIWVIVFKMQFCVPDLASLHYRLPINLVPFGASVIANGRVYLPEIIENVIAFIPFGLFVSMLAKRGGLWKSVVFGLLLSLAFETVQYALAIGSADITDLITNTAGALIGALLWFPIRALLKEKAGKVLSIILLAGELAVTAFLAILLISNL